jgi:hypothetical protein
VNNCVVSFICFVIQQKVVSLKFTFFLYVFCFWGEGFFVGGGVGGGGGGGPPPPRSGGEGTEWGEGERRQIQLFVRRFFNCLNSDGTISLFDITP